MSENNQGRALAIFMDAIEKPHDQRAAFVRAACTSDQALLAEVQSLLDSHACAGGFLGSPTAGRTPEEQDAPNGPLHEGPGSMIGPYKLLQLIGEGGFGSVFMAEQESPVRRTVALKIIKLGMDTKQVIARFEAERQALAIMDHPHIAKVFEAGATESGRPYFVMELVRGVSITHYCDTHDVSVPERLELFAKVCQAVQHAHSKGIIHRDLKPSNIMVTLADGKPAPKVIDFGISKATDRRLTEKTVFTEFRQMIGTPQYMSPEQAETAGIDIDTRTDVYSLGVLLYELLVGSTPFDPKELLHKAYAEMQRIIREVEPDRPSTRFRTRTDKLAAIAASRRIDPAKLGRLLKGELDWIVMRAMDKDPTRRYATASELATDVRRHLNNEPVLARPPSTLYRLRKFARKHRVVVLATAAVAAALLLAVIGTSIGLVRARSALAASRIAEADAVAQKKIAERLLQEVTIARAEADIGRAKSNALAFQELGCDLARHGRFLEALHYFDASIQLNPSQHWAWYRRGCVLAYLGNDREAYRANCSGMLERFANDRDWSVVDRTIKTCLLMPAPEDPKRLVELARGYVAEAKRTDRGVGLAELCQALAFYRFGDYSSSLALAQTFTSTAPHLFQVTAGSLIALDLERLNRHGESIATLQGLRELVTRLPKSGQDDLGENPEDWIVCQTLLHEAYNVVRPDGPATAPAPH